MIKMMEVTNYDFGHIWINGKEYTNDIVLYKKNIHTDRWRDEGHFLKQKDLSEVVSLDQVDKIFIGQGYYGKMEVDDKLLKYFHIQKISFEKGKTGEIVEKYNKRDNKKNTALAVHLTC